MQAFPKKHHLLTALAACTLAACSTMPASTPASTPQMDASSGPQATARLEATRGNAVTGTVTFTQHGSDHVTVVAKVDGLKPGQAHGFHLHEKGDCSSGDGMSAGGHFNPTGQPHGPQGGAHHAGDMPSLKADAAGHAELQAELHGVTVAAGPTSVVGHGVIVHAGPDDYVTQPTGNSGARLACGIVALD
jgi:superoxide dismutase, Cu-Zn family